MHLFKVLCHLHAEKITWFRWQNGTFGCKKRFLVSVPFLGGILGWEVWEIEQCLVENFHFKPKRDFVSLGTKLGSNSCQKLDTEGKKCSRSTGTSLGKGRKGGISLSRVLFPIFAWKQPWKSTFGERNRDFEVSWVISLCGFQSGLLRAVTFSLFGFASSGATQNILIVCISASAA